MSKSNPLSRRSFLGVCAATVALLSGSRPAAGTPIQAFKTIRLVDRDGRPLLYSDLTEGVAYVFHYPFVSTPCFLIRLDRPVVGGVTLLREDKTPYQWPGGVGPDHNLVAYSAICAHRMTHPKREITFIGYRQQSARFLDSQKQSAQRARVIYCCSEKSVYDVTQGARVLGGPAPQPLATVLLRHDGASDQILATGVAGGTLFDRFLDEYGFRLALDMGRKDIGRLAENNAEAMPLSEYSHTRVGC